MKVVGLTGGIGMGKSTVAKAFRRARIPVFDADAAVHRLQAPGGRAVRPIAQAFPGTGRDTPSGLGLDRAALRNQVLADPAALKRLEAIVHPLVRAEQRRFLAAARRARRRLAVLDVPLLFETRGDRATDAVVVVSAPLAVQIQRVRRRRGMTEAQIRAIIAKQMPDPEKRRRADHVVQTGLSRHHSLRQIRRVIAGLMEAP